MNHQTCAVGLFVWRTVSTSSVVFRIVRRPVTLMGVVPQRVNKLRGYSRISQRCFDMDLIDRSKSVQLRALVMLNIMDNLIA